VRLALFFVAIALSGFAAAFVRSGPAAQIGVAVIESGHLRATNNRPFAVLSAAKIIPAAMALETHDPALAPLARLSVVNSDNKAADELTARLGGKVAVQRWLASKRLPTAFATEAEMIANPTAYELRPSELALVLYRIQTPALIALMAQTKTGNDRIRAAFPGAPHKSGTWGDKLVDVGMVNGRIIAVMGERVTPADLAAAAAR
jgi:hypothetical protein